MSNKKTSVEAATGSVGKEVLSYCTSCKMDLNHVIIAMEESKIAKVQCLTCKKEHLFREPKGSKSASAKKRKKSTDSSQEGEASVSSESSAHSIELEWQRLMELHQASAVKPYTMKAQFQLGDRLNHSSFGEGIVSKLIYPNKLEVIFRTDIKVMIHAGSV